LNLYIIVVGMDVREWTTLNKRTTTFGRKYLSNRQWIFVL